MSETTFTPPTSAAARSAVVPLRFGSPRSTATDEPRRWNDVPPAALLAVHRPDILEDLLADVLRRLAQPVRHFAGPSGGRDLCGVLHFQYSSDGRIHVNRGGAGGVLHGLTVRDLDLLRPLDQERWLDALGDELRLRLDLASVHQPPPGEDYVAWALSALRARLERIPAWNDFAVDIEADLDLSPAIARHAMRMCANQPPPTRVCDDYSLLAMHRAAIERLALDNEELVPLFAAFCNAGGFPAEGEPIERLSAFLADQGFSPALWRRLAAPGGVERYLPLIIAHYRETPWIVEQVLVGLDRFDSALASPWWILDVVIRARLAERILRCIDLIGPELEPPGWLIDCALRAGIDPDDRRHAPPPPALAMLARRLAVLHGQADEARRVAMIEMADLVLAWGRSGYDLREDALRRTGWATIARRARESRDRREKHDAPFPVPFERVALDGYEVTAIASPLAMWDEGHAMRHCASTWTERCAAGSMLLCSARALSNPDERWTLALERSGEQWQPKTAAGFANAKAPDAVKSLVRVLAAWLSARTLAAGSLLPDARTAANEPSPSGDGLS